MYFRYSVKCWKNTKTAFFHLGGAPRLVGETKKETNNYQGIRTPKSCGNTGKFLNYVSGMNEPKFPSRMTPSFLQPLP
jgi:hypothetical protein